MSPFVTSKDPGQGTGLGLWVVFNLVQRLGAEVSISSPAENSPLRYYCDPYFSTIIAAMSNSNPKNILIVEDEDIIRSSLRKLLERHHYEVSEAVSVKAARESFNLNSFDLIISDLRLPGGPGTDLINPAGCVPVLVMTSYASLRSAVETMRQGAADYISKPFDHDEMVSAVKRIINESKQDCGFGDCRKPPTDG